MKTCSICKIEQPLDGFIWQNKKLNKKMSYCKICNRKRQNDKRITEPELQKQKDKDAYQKYKKRRTEYARRYRIEKPEKTRATHLKMRYGMSIDDYDSMFLSQKGNCKICGLNQNDIKKKLGVDHCHASGKVRGLLCDTCNRFLGFYEKLAIQCDIYLQESMTE